MKTQPALFVIIALLLVVIGFQTLDRRDADIAIEKQRVQDQKARDFDRKFIR